MTGVDFCCGPQTRNAVPMNYNFRQNVVLIEPSLGTAALWFKASSRLLASMHVHQTQLVQVLESIEAWIDPIVVKLGMRLGTKKCQVLRRSRFAEWWDYPATEWSVVWGNDGGVPMAVFLFHEYAWSFKVTHIVGEYERVRDLMRRMALRVVAMGLLSLIWSAFTVVAKFSPPSAPDPGQLRLRSSPGSNIRHQLLVL